MALFADGVTCTIEDLTDQDSGLLDVSQTGGINVSVKMRLAHEEIAEEIRLWLDRTRPALDITWVAPLRLEQVVVTPALRQWEVLMALSLVYRDAYFSQLVDRYQRKWEEFAQLTRRAYERFVASGMGLVNRPVRQAAPPILASTPGPQRGGTFYASIAWVNQAGQEGAPSSPNSITISDGNLMTISAADPVSDAVGFNVYAGADIAAMYRQNDNPLPAGVAFTYVPSSVGGGRLPGNGQKPDFIRPLTRTILRG